MRGSFQHSNNGLDHNENDDEDEDDNENNNDDKDKDNGDNDYHLCILFYGAWQVLALGREGVGRRLGSFKCSNNGTEQEETTTMMAMTMTMMMMNVTMTVRLNLTLPLMCTILQSLAIPALGGGG